MNFAADHHIKCTTLHLQHLFWVAKSITFKQILMSYLFSAGLMNMREEMIENLITLFFPRLSAKLPLYVHYCNRGNMVYKSNKTHLESLIIEPPVPHPSILGIEWKKVLSLMSGVQLAFCATFIAEFGCRMEIRGLICNLEKVMKRKLHYPSFGIVLVWLVFAMFVGIVLSGPKPEWIVLDTLSYQFLDRLCGRCCNLSIKGFRRYRKGLIWPLQAFTNGFHSVICPSFFHMYPYILASICSHRCSMV